MGRNARTAAAAQPAKKATITRRPPAPAKLTPDLPDLIGGYGYEGAPVLDEFGQSFPPAPLPKGVRRGAISRRFANAYYLAAKKGLRYAEGVAVAMNWKSWVTHAWVVADDDSVIDPTSQEPGVAYFGVIVPLQWLEGVVARSDYWGVRAALDAGVVTTEEFRAAVISERYECMGDASR